MKNGRELAGDRDPGSRHATTLGDLNAPRSQGRPLFAANQKRMGCFVERRARQLVAAWADPALDVYCAGLIASWDQTEVSADIPRFAEPLQLIKRRPEGQSCHRTDTRSAHQSPTDRLVPHGVENLFGQPRNSRSITPRIVTSGSIMCAKPSSAPIRSLARTTKSFRAGVSP